MSNQKVFGFDEATKALAALASPKVRAGALLEIGLFGEAETKKHTPVDKGVLRASIGHVEAGGNSDDAVFTVDADSVMWGTNVHYAPWIEDGFTMATRRLVNLPGIGWRWVSPFSYTGAHMFEKGLATAAHASKAIFSAHIEMAAGGLA